MIEAIGTFRTHILLPNEVVGGVIEDLPNWRGMWREGEPNAYSLWRNNRKILSVAKHWADATRLNVKVTAHETVWIQEPGLTTRVSGEASWRGFCESKAGFEWTSAAKSMRQKDAHLSTVHFYRNPAHPDYTTGVELEHEGKRYRIRSAGGFADLLVRWQARKTKPNVPWLRCSVADKGPLLGTTSGPEMPLRWELAGVSRPIAGIERPRGSWLHLLGWTGGAGGVVAKDGRERGWPANRYLWQPRTWVQLLHGRSIRQDLRLEVCA